MNENRLSQEELAQLGVSLSRIFKDAGALALWFVPVSAVALWWWEGRVAGALTGIGLGCFAVLWELRRCVWPLIPAIRLAAPVENTNPPEGTQT